jgi:hypothetical protein
MGLPINTHMIILNCKAKFKFLEDCCKRNFAELIESEAFDKKLGDLNNLIYVYNKI